MAHRSKLLAAALLLGVSAHMAAQNVVSNSTFDTALPPWLTYLSSSPDPAATGPAPAWDSTHDVNGSVTSGSALVGLDTGANNLSNAASGISQCVDLGSLQAINFVNYKASFLLPVSGNSNSGANATVEVRFYGLAGCNDVDFIPGAGGSQGLNFSAGSLSDTVWHTAADTNFQPPPGTQARSVLVRAFVRKVGDNTNSYQAYFDGVFVRINDSTPVELDRFRVE